MISRRLIVCFALFAPLEGALAQEAWTTYRNTRFGTAIESSDSRSNVERRLAPRSSCAHRPFALKFAKA